MKKKKPKKILNFRCSDEFHILLKAVVISDKFKKIGIVNLTDLFRYSIIELSKKNKIPIDNYPFNNIDEIYEHKKRY